MSNDYNKQIIYEQIMNDLNKFPIEVFHPKIKETINEIQRVYEVNPDVISSHILTTAGFPLNNVYQVKLTEDRIIRPNIWLLHYGYSGSAKSPLMYMITKSIDKKSFEINQSTSEKNEMEFLINTPTIEKVYQLSLGQFTPEGMNKVLEKNQGHSVIIRQDEISGLFKSFNQYSKGQGEEDFLKNYNYNGESIARVDDKRNIFIKERNVSIIGCTQPQKVFEIMTKDRIYNGNVFRWLFVFDENDYSEKNSFQSLLKVSNTFNPMLNFNEMMNHFLKDYENDINRTDLVFNEECLTYSAEWINKVKKEFSNDIEKELLTSIISKMEDYLIKISIILNRTRQYYNNKLYDNNISIEDVRNSGLVVKYFISNTIKLLNKVVDPTSKHFKTENEKEFYYNLPNTFMGSDFVSLCQSQLGVSYPTGQRLLRKWTSKEVHLIGKNRHNEYYKLVG